MNSRHTLSIDHSPRLPESDDETARGRGGHVVCGVSKSRWARLCVHGDGRVHGPSRHLTPTSIAVTTTRIGTCKMVGSPFHLAAGSLFILPVPSRGTTWRPAWPRCWPANFSSAHPGSGSPGWASVWGAGSAFRRGRFRLRPTGGGGVGAGIVGKGQSGRACAEPASRPTASRRGGGAERGAWTPVSTRAWCWPDDAASDHGAGVRHGLRAAIDAVAGVRTPRAPATDDRGLV